MSKHKIMLISIFFLIIISFGTVSASEYISGNDEGNIDSDKLLTVDSHDVYSANSLDFKNLNSNSVDDLRVETNSVDDLNTETNSADDSSIEINDSNSNSATEQEPKSIKVSGNTFTDIQKAIYNASENDTIILDGTFNATGRDMIIVDRAIVLQGSDNMILDGNGFSVRFRLDCPNITFKNISFMNFNITDRNSAIIQSAYGFTAEGCRFLNNTGDYISAIYIYGGSSKIENCQFLNNKNNYGTIYLNCSEARISNCLFKENSKISKENYINIYYERDLSYSLISSFDSNLSLMDCDFLNNNISATSVIGSNCTIEDIVIDNGLSAIGSYCSNLSINKSVFNNLSDGISLIGGNNTIDCSNFTENTGLPLYISDDCCHGEYNIKNSEFISNTYSEGPSAIWIYDSTANIENCKFNENANKTKYGVIFIESTQKVAINGNNKTSTYNDVRVIDNDLKAYQYIIIAPSKSFNTSFNSGKALTGKVYYGFNKEAYKGFWGEAYLKDTKSKSEEYSWYYYHTDSNGKFSIVFTGLSAGTYSCVLGLEQDGAEDIIWRFITGKSTVKISKSKTVVKAPKMTAKKGKSKYFKVTVKNRVTKKVVKKIVLKVKIYTGKKYKTYTVKTNSRGIAKLNTKKLKKGTHKVVITSSSKNYIVSKKSSIKIK